MYVIDKPKAFLRMDGGVVFLVSLILFGATHQPWWWVPVLLFVPDAFMAGYAKSTNVGALIYNLGHSYLLPSAVALLGWRAERPLILAMGLIWLAHVGMDRAAGYGLKYDDNFKHTHLGDLFKK